MSATLVFWAVVGIGAMGLILSGYRPLPLDLPRKRERPKLYTNEEALQMLKEAADKLEATNASLKASTDHLEARVRAMEKRLEGKR